MDARGAQLIAEVGAPGAGADGVIGPVHDVVGEQLRATVEELGERLLPVLGVELVLLLHRNPGKLSPLLGQLLAELGMLGLELRKLAASCLPFLAGSNRVLGHREPPLDGSSVRPRYAAHTLRPAGRAELIAASPFSGDVRFGSSA